MEVFILMNGFDIEQPSFTDGVFSSIENALMILISIINIKNEDFNCYFLMYSVPNLIIYENAKGYKYWIKKFLVF